MSKAVGTPVNFTKTYNVTGTKSGLKSSKDKSHCLSSRVVRGICQSEECFEGQTAWPGGHLLEIKELLNA